MTSTQPGAGAPPPGWHPDPYGRHQGRYWDGSTWTEHVDDAGQQSVDPPPPPADTTVLDQPAVLFQHQEIRGAEQAATLSVNAADDQRSIGWVHYADHDAELVDLDGARLFRVGARFGDVTRQRPWRDDFRTPGMVKSVGVWGAFGEELAQSSTSQSMNRWTFDLRVGRQSVVSARLVRGRHGELGQAELTAGGTPIGSVTEQGRTQAGNVVSSWLRLDRAPGLAEPLRTLTTAVPLVFLTAFN